MYFSSDLYELYLYELSQIGPHPNKLFKKNFLSIMTTISMLLESCFICYSFSICLSNFFKDPDMFWDFISLRPETTHQVSFLFSNRGTPDGYRQMNGYGSHTFKMVNKEGHAVYCKFHLKVLLTIFLIIMFYIVLIILSLQIFRC